MDAKKALSIFGQDPSTSTSQQKRPSQGVPENSRLSKDFLNYKSLNESLFRKITQTKAQLSQSEKVIERLREENQELRERNQKLSESCEEEKIELIVSQRLQSKLAHINAINQRTIQFLQNAGNDMKEALKEIEPETKPFRMKRDRKKLSAEPLLDKVEESPLKRLKSHEVSSDIVELDSSGDENEALEVPNINEKRTSKGRRSALFDVRNMEPETPRAVFNPPKRAPLLIKPKSPEVSTSSDSVDTKSRNSKSVVRKPRAKKSDSDGFGVPATPQPTTPAVGSDSARRQRAAKSKVTSLKEPSLGSKLRNPGRFDEPVPYIDRFFFN